MDDGNDNLKNLYKVDQIPSDTYLRERLDMVELESIQSVFKKIIQACQRGKVLKEYEYFDGKLLVSIDGTEYYKSKKVWCENCCTKKHRDGSITYYHQLLGGSIINPDKKAVLPLCPEMIQQTDGTSKNDCEINAIKRLLKKMKTDYPKLSFIVVEDGLYANGPHIKELKEYGYSFIIGAKPGNLNKLFESVSNNVNTKTDEITEKDGVTHQFRYKNTVSINDSHREVTVNFLEYTQIKDQKVVYHGAWITDIPLNKDTVYKVMKGGRARWKIENETFNTLKNQSYNFEHNFGHGIKNLSSVMAHLMMLAFLIDQVQLNCCDLFNEALANCQNRKGYLWRRMRSAYFEFHIPSWEALYRHIAVPLKTRVKQVLPGLVDAPYYLAALLFL